MSAILQDAEKYPAADYTVGIAIINVLWQFKKLKYAALQKDLNIAISFNPTKSHFLTSQK